MSSRYIPALRFDRLTGLYDPVVAMTTRERTFKKRLVEQVGALGRCRVLDLGCGTGTLTIAIAERYPHAEVHALDGDPAVLARARAKIERARVRVQLHEGLAQDPPFPPGMFDRVVSSLVFHHLSHEDKRRAFARVAELLAPDGELHLADWGRPHGPVTRAAFLAVQLLDGFETTRDHAAGRLPSIMEDAGFDVEVTRRLRAPLGTIELYRARRRAPV